MNPGRVCIEILHDVLSCLIPYSSCHMIHVTFDMHEVMIAAGNFYKKISCNIQNAADIFVFLKKKFQAVCNFSHAHFQILRATKFL